MQLVHANRVIQVLSPVGQTGRTPATETQSHRGEHGLWFQI
jgi:hypothetical protein